MDVRISTCMASWLGQIEPVRLTPPIPVSQDGISWPVALALGIAMFGMVVALLVRWRAARRRPHLDRAFHGLARRLHLSRRRRRLVEQLAQRASVPAVALLISEHAFDQAASALEPVVAHASVPRDVRIEAKPRTGGLSEGALLALRRALFGEP